MRQFSTFLLITFHLLRSFEGWAQEPKLILPIGHTLGVSTAVFSPDGKRMVTSALDNTAKIWEVSSGLLLANLLGHTDTVCTATYSPDGRKIVTACEDGSAKIWDASSTGLLINLIGHTGKVYAATFSPDGKKIVTAGEDSTAKIWDAETGKMLADLKGHIKAIWRAEFSPDGKKIVTASDDSTAKVWDVASGKMIADLRGHKFEVWTAQFSPDNKRVVTGSGDSTARVWNAETGQLIIDFKQHKGGIRFASFSPDGKRVLTGSDDGTAKSWDAGTGEVYLSLIGKKDTHPNDDSYYPDIVRAANFTRDGKKILTVYLDSSFKIWDASTGKLLKQIKRNYEYVNSAGFSPDGKKLVLGLAYAHAEIWDMETGKLGIDLKGRANYNSGFIYSSDGKRILATSWPGSGKLLDAATGALVAIFPANKDMKQQGVYAGFSPDGKRIISTAYENNAKVYDAVTGALLLELKGHHNTVWSAWFSADGKKIYTQSQDSTARIWDANTGRLLVQLKGKDPYNTLRITADGKRGLLYSYQDSVARIFDPENGKLISEMVGHLNEFMNPEFSPDGKKVINGYYFDTAKVWNVESGKLMYGISEPGYRIRTTTFTPDGKRVIIVSIHKQNKVVTVKIYDAESGKFLTGLDHEGSSFRYNVFFTPDEKKIITDSENGTFSFWNVETGVYLGSYAGLAGPVYWLSFSPDRKKAVAGSNDGVVKIFDAETGQVLKELKEHTFTDVSATFTPDGKKIVTVSHDNTVKVWDAETGQSLYTYVSLDDDDYLFLDKNNHFDGTEGARKLLYFTCGTEVIELDQVKDQLWVPNLVERILRGETINAAKLSDLNVCNLTPLMDTLEQSPAQYRFRVTPRLGGLGATIVYVNGIEVKRYTPQQLIKGKGEYQLVIDKKELQKLFVPNKENTITVKGLTEKNSISSRSVSISEKGNEISVAPPNLYAVVVGVSDYKGEELDLRFAAKDAVDIGNAIDLSAKKLLNADGKEHVFVYKINTGTDRDRFPEKNSIRQVFTEISGKAKPNDILLVFFAGHGVMESLPAGQAGEKNKFYFLTADASNATVSGALKDVGISTEELSDWIKPQVMKAQKRILIFDACNSGQAIKELVGIGKEGQNLLASRGDDKGKQTKAIEKLNERSGMFILSASASDQKAYEMGKYGQGALTYSLLKAIKDQPDILEDRKYLNLSRWFNAAEKLVGEVARETGARQQPQLVSTTNFNVGVVDDEVRNKILLPFEKPLFTRSDIRNIDLRIDNLKLRNAVDKKLEELSDDDRGAQLLFNTDYDGAEVYSISGDYKIAGNELTASLILTKGGTDIKSQFEVKGTTENVNELAQFIAAKVLEWLNKKE